MHKRDHLIHSRGGRAVAVRLAARGNEPLCRRRCPRCLPQSRSGWQRHGSADEMSRFAGSWRTAVADGRQVGQLIQIKFLLFLSSSLFFLRFPSGRPSTGDLYPTRRPPQRAAKTRPESSDDGAGVNYGGPREPVIDQIKGTGLLLPATARHRAVETKVRPRKPSGLRRRRNHWIGCSSAGPVQLNGLCRFVLFFICGRFCVVFFAPSFSPSKARRIDCGNLVRRWSEQQPAMSPRNTLTPINRADY